LTLGPNKFPKIWAFLVLFLRDNLCNHIFGYVSAFKPKSVYLTGQRQKCTWGRRGESNFRIEIFTNISRNGQKDEFGTPCPELVLLAVPNIREYFYTKIRFSMPAHVGLRVFCAYCKKCRVDLGSKSFGWPNVHVLIGQVSQSLRSTCHTDVTC
jgi:hypothetical protein